MSLLPTTAHRLLSDLDPFSAASGRRLRPYQLDCARAVVESVTHRRGRIITIMFARQMGKNETSAQLEAYLLTLYARRGGSIIKAAPSFKPQIINSIARLTGTLNENPLTRGRWRSSFGYMLEMGRVSIAFFSADQHANVVGATASLLLEIDEAQNVDPDKYDRDFRPMASSTNATTVLYGTAWGQDSILERQRRINLEHEHQTGERLHFEYDWRVLAAVSPSYAEYVGAEISRLGEHHPTVQTQYFLRPLTDAGRLFSAEQRAAISGTHRREPTPRPGAVYAAGVDLAGTDEQADDAAARALSPRRDSTVVTIAEIDRDRNGSPVARVVDHLWWTGRDHVWQYERLSAVWERWQFARVCVDASGIGAGVAAFLAERFGPRVEKFVFTSPSKSKLGYDLLGMANTGRLSLYADDDSPEWRQCQREISACRYWLRANEQLQWSVPPAEGHDDFVTSLALCCRAVNEAAPLAFGTLVRPPPPTDDSW